MSIATLSMIFIAIYSIFILLVAFKLGYSKETVSTSTGYFIGKGTKTFVLVFSTAAAGYSTWVFQGAPASVYSNGVGWMMVVVVWLMTIQFNIGYFGPRGWRLSKHHQFITIGEMLDRYYQSKRHIMNILIGALQIIALVPSSMAQIKGMGLAISNITEGIIPFWAAALYVCLLVGIYCFVGGFGSLSLVDTAQGLMFVTIVWGCVGAVLLHIGGGLGSLYDILEAYNEQLLLFATSRSAYWTFSMAVTFPVMQVLGGMAQPVFWQRFFAAKSGTILVKSSRMLIVLYSLGVIIPATTVGIAGNAFSFLNYSSPDNVFQTLMTYIHPFWGIAVTIGILAAGMSTVAGSLVASSSILTMDVIRPLTSNTNDEFTRKTGKGMVLLLTVVSYLLALYTPASITMLLAISLSILAMVVLPLSGLFFWKRASHQGAMAGMIVGMIALVYFTFINPHYLSVFGGFWGFAFGVVTFVAVSLMTKPVSSEHRDAFLKPLKDHKARPQTIVD